MRESRKPTIPSSLASAVSQAQSRRMPTGLRSVSLRDWLYLHREALLIGAILLVAGLAHGINMFSFPFYETDEGTYMAQAWAATKGQLSHYTYWYDHAPWGWFQIAGWSLITGGFYTFGESVNSGRVLMLLFQLATVYLLYRTARTMTGSVLAATVSSLVFALSAYGIYYHRRVLLDNIATFWVMLALFILVSGRLTLTRVWLSAAALSIAILSKEVAIFVVPAMLYLVLYRAHSSQRWYAVTGWLALVGSILSTYVLLATLKLELFPQGTLLGGDHEHVSLIGSLQTQMSRDQDAGVFDLNSGFWNMTINYWAEAEPLLVIGGTLCALVSVLLIRWHRLAGIVGLMTMSLWLFLSRGGVVIEFYLVPLLPLLALNIGLVLDLVVRQVRKLVEHRPHIVKPAFGNLARVATVGVCLALILPGYSSSALAFNRNALTLWENSQVKGQNLAKEWAKLNIPHESRIIMDAYMWVDLQDPPRADASPGLDGWPRAHWYWRVDPDPEIREQVFHNNWNTVDYLVDTRQMRADIAQEAQRMPIVTTAMEHSTIIKEFNTGGYTVNVRRVDKLHQLAATEDPVLRRTWDSYKARFLRDGRVIDPKRNNEISSEAQAYTMLRSVYMNDRQTFDRVWSWTQANLQVRSDNLLAWRWGALDNEKQGVIDPNAATDGDQDAALALLFASKRWDEPSYRNEAMKILESIWTHETVEVNGQRIVVAGNWAQGKEDDEFEHPVVNPSYFTPYAYRIFAEADPSHPWGVLVDSSYNVLSDIRDVPELGGAAGLVPDWLAVDEQSGDLVRAEQMGQRADVSSFEASRLPWRLAVDWLWFKDDRAKQAMESSRLPLQELERTGRAAPAYNLDGSHAAEYQSVATHAGMLGGLLFSENQEAVHKVFADQIYGAYHGNAGSAYWGDPESYYDQNWAWFATLLMDGGLANLWEGQTSVQWDQTLSERC